MTCPTDAARIATKMDTAITIDMTHGHLPANK
jgi:hypothetical protein